MGAEEVADGAPERGQELGADLRIVRNGSRGLYWLEPMIEVDTPARTSRLRARRSAEDAASFFEPSSCSSGDHRLRLGLTEEIPYLKNQERLTFARVGITDPVSLDDYLAHGGYRGLEHAHRDVRRANRRRSDDLGFARTRRRRLSRRHQMEDYARHRSEAKIRRVQRRRRRLRNVLRSHDHGRRSAYVLIEGMTIAAIAVGATKGYIYLRSEYPDALRTLNEAIEARDAGRLSRCEYAGSGKAFVSRFVVGAGAYICGEETAMLESLEGKRGMVRFKPPLPAIAGLVRPADRHQQCDHARLGADNYRGRRRSSITTSAWAARAARFRFNWRVTSSVRG